MDKVFKNGSNKICGRQPLENMKGYGLLKPTILGSFLNALSHIRGFVTGTLHKK